MVRSDLVIAGSNFIFSHIFDNYGEYIEKKNNKLLVIFRGEGMSTLNISLVFFVLKMFYVWKILGSNCNLYL